MGTRVKALYEEGAHARFTCFFGDMSRTTAIGALETADKLKISSWDGYLLELARRMNLLRVYTIDEDLRRRVHHI